MCGRNFCLVSWEHLPSSMSPRGNAQVAFASAVTVLLLSAIAAYVTVARLRESAGWVVHSFEVETTLGEIDSSMAKLARARSAYAITGDETLREAFRATLPEVRQKLQLVRKLTEDNPRQQEMCNRLENLTDRRINLGGYPLHSPRPYRLWFAFGLR